MAQQNRDDGVKRDKPQQPREPQPERKDQEKVRGGASQESETKPIQRQPGRMPLPD